MTPHFKRFIVVATALALVAAIVPAANGQELDSLMKIKPGKSKAVTSSSQNPNSNLDRIRYIKSGETKVLFDATGPAVIRHIWLTFNEARPNWLEPGGSARPDEVILRMYWDGEETPSVEAPASDFFAVGHGRFAPVNSLPVVVNPANALNCFWPMPFRTRARITLSNETAQDVELVAYQITYVETEVPAAAGTFHAQYRRQSSSGAGNSSSDSVRSTVPEVAVPSCSTNPSPLELYANGTSIIAAYSSPCCIPALTV